MSKSLFLHMRTKILVLCISCTVLALTLQTLFFQRSASAIVYEQERAASINSLQNLQNELYGQIKSYENSLIRIYAETNFLRDLSAEISIEDLVEKYGHLAYDMAVTVFDPSQNVGAVYIYDTNEHLISRHRSANTPRYNYPQDLFENPAMSNAAAIRRYIASDDRTMLVSSYYNSSRERNLIRFVLKVFASNAVDNIGFIVCDADPVIFVRTMQKYAYSPTQSLWLQPLGDRQILLHGSFDPEIEKFYRGVLLRTEDAADPVEEDLVVKGNVFLSLPQDKYNLTAFSLTPQYLLEESQAVLRNNLLLIVVMVVAIAVAAAFLISLGLTYPLKRMVAGLEQIKSGKTDIRMEILNRDEIGELGKTINEMLDRIQDLVAQEYHLEMLLKQAEYRTLQAQVNPHFLYNSLDTMSGIAASQDCHTVSDMCSALSNIFRYSIDMKNPLSTIGSEILHIKNYMYVMNTRMQNGVELEVDLDGQLMQVPIPRLSLQPIVENSLNHGLRHKRGKKVVRIEGRADGAHLALSIIDNGIGMDEAEIASLIASAPEDTLEMTDSIGLANINARLRILFGPEFGIRISSGAGEGSTVTLRLPCPADTEAPV